MQHEHGGLAQQCPREHGAHCQPRRAHLLQVELKHAVGDRARLVQQPEQRGAPVASAALRHAAHELDATADERRHRRRPRHVRPARRRRALSLGQRERPRLCRRLELLPPPPAVRGASAEATRSAALLGDELFERRQPQQPPRRHLPEPAAPLIILSSPLSIAQHVPRLRGLEERKAVVRVDALQQLHASAAPCAAQPPPARVRLDAQKPVEVVGRGV